jgi:hypothetical protein
MPNTDNFVVYTIRRVGQLRSASEEKAPGDAIRVEADEYGNVLFRKDKIPADKVESGLENCLALGRKLISRASELGKDYRLESITLKLALDADVGIAFVGDASIEAGIEVEIRRQDAVPASPAAGTNKA